MKAGRRTLAEVDAMTGTEFEELVASLCRRDGCTEVRRVGGSHDNGADVLGRLPDSRTMVVQCKRYAPGSTIASRELRDLLGAKVHFRADVAVFVTTTRFSRPSEKFAVEHGEVRRGARNPRRTPGSPRTAEQRCFPLIAEPRERSWTGQFPPPSALEAGVRQVTDRAEFKRPRWSPSTSVRHPAYSRSAPITREGR